MKNITIITFLLLLAFSLSAQKGAGTIGGGGGSGTVSSVGLTMPTGFSVTGSPVTSSGTLGITTILNGPLRGDGSGFAVGNLNLASEVTGRLPFANLTQGSALSILGVAGNATADNASIAAASDHNVLRRSGTAIGFGAINLASTNAVTGILPTGNGGTGATSLSSAGIVTNSTGAATQVGFWNSGGTFSGSNRLKFLDASNPSFDLEGTASTVFRAITNATSASSFSVFIGRRSFGTLGSPANITDSTAVLVQLAGQPYLAGNWRANGGLRMEGDGVMSGSAFSTRWVFSTVSGSSSTVVDRFWIDRLGRVGIGAAPASASSIFDVTSTTQGSRPAPSMTTTQRNAITSPVAGLQVYNSSLNKLNFYNGSAWRALVDSTTLAGYLPLTGGTLTGHLLFTDNNFDIGASGATRPRNGYFGTSLVAPTINATTTLQIGGTNTDNIYAKLNGNDGQITIGSNTAGLNLESDGTRRMTIPEAGIANTPTSTKALVLSPADSLGYTDLQSSDYTATVTQSGSDTLQNGAICYGHFQRVGNYVTFTVRIEVALTATGNANTVYFDPPIASNFTTAASDVIGVAGLDAQGLSSADVKKQRCLLFASDSDDKIGISFDPVASLTFPENRVYISASGSYIIQ